MLDAALGSTGARRFVRATVVAMASLGGPATSPAARTAGGRTDHHGACRNGYVGLTYDDGPTAATTEPLLRALRTAHARATFFDLAANARQSPDLVRAQQRAGMWIGNHAYSHPHLTQIGEPAAFQTGAAAAAGPAAGRVAPPEPVEAVRQVRRRAALVAVLDDQQFSDIYS